MKSLFSPILMIFHLVYAIVKISVAIVKYFQASEIGEKMLQLGQIVGIIVRAIVNGATLGVFRKKAVRKIRKMK